ncbi:MAG: polyphosphate kinase 1, partial [Bacteroidales bacterium]|jgi:polyphosphate kinase|nr:polyphosphate kinase 1 [Bacteroidales bacterium]
LNHQQTDWIYDYFTQHIRSQLIPLMLNEQARLPLLQDDRLYLGVKLTSKHAYRYAIIEIPPSSLLPRFVVLPPAQESLFQLIFVDDIIRLCLERIFFMYAVKNAYAYAFKITRDAELDFDDDLSKNYVEKMRESLSKRPYGQTVRLVYDALMPVDLLHLIRQKLNLKTGDSIIPGGRYHNFRDLMAFPTIRSDLEDVVYRPHNHPQLKLYSSMLKIIRKNDILLHYPYQTFSHFLDFLIEAATDPYVQEIFITLYRVADRSKVINVLANAARNGKQVTVVIELQARFDEKANIHWTNLLQRTNVKVLHGMKGLKVHCKIALVKRKKQEQTVNYAYIGTGNFNETTAALYSDLGLFTSHQGITQDVEKVFTFLETAIPFECNHLLVAPYRMRQQLEAFIEQETKNATNGREAFIYMKLNSLVDEEMIKLLYKAGKAGVDIRLIVRGICCLQPQVPGLSENIQCISIVDKLLEHSRIAIFCNGGDYQYFIMSADLMSRNLNRRIEVGTPVYDKNIRQMLCNIFEIQWNDNVKARNMSPTLLNTYVPRKDGEAKVRSQTELYTYFGNLSL